MTSQHTEASPSVGRPVAVSSISRDSTTAKRSFSVGADDESPSLAQCSDRRSTTSSRTRRATSWWRKPSVRSNRGRSSFRPTAVPHATYAEQLAGSLASEHGANLTILNVATGDRDDAETFVRDRQAALERAGLEIESVVLPDGDVARAILEYAEENNFDTIVAGAAQAGLVPQTLFGDIAEEVGERFGEEVLMVRKYRFVSICCCQVGTQMVRQSPGAGKSKRELSGARFPTRGRIHRR